MSRSESRRHRTLKTQQNEPAQPTQSSGRKRKNTANGDQTVSKRGRKKMGAQKEAAADPAGSRPSQRPQLLPVTLLSGFLGSGKTTLLTHILTSKDHGLRVCVLVNDMAELNIDGATAANLVQREEKLVQMQNGCICCTLRQDLLEEVHRLACARKFDYLVIESTGISEPLQVAETFTFPLPTENGEGGDQNPIIPHVHAPGETCSLEGTLMSVARLDTCVTVVDCATFFDNLNSIEELKDRHGDEVPEGDERNIASLLVDQVEFANVILLNKTDLVNKTQLARIRRLVAALNPAAEVHETRNARVPLSVVLNTRKFSLEKAAMSAGWLQAIAPGAPAVRSESDEYGIRSFVYRARRPFHPGRLYHDFLSKYFLTRIIKIQAGEDEEDGDDEGEGEDSDGEEEEEETEQEKEEGNEDAASDPADKEPVSAYEEARNEALAARDRALGGLMRSKGYMWLATAPDDMLGWSHAGALVTVHREGPWFASLPEDVWPDDPEVKAKIRADFDPDRPEEVGDRRQELVFIGQGLKEDAIRAALDACLATEEEIKAAVAGELPDPVWGDDDEDDEDEEEEEGSEQEESSHEESKGASSEDVSSDAAEDKREVPLRSGRPQRARK